MLLAEPIPHTSKWYMDFVEIFNVLPDLPDIILLILIRVELLLCLDVTLCKNAITCFLESSWV